MMGSTHHLLLCA